MNKLLLPVLMTVVMAGCGSNDAEKVSPEPRGKDNMAYRWGSISLWATANDTERFRPRPTVTSRILGLIWTAVYDAWTRYDEKAKPMFLEGVERMPESERTLENKEKAISYACFRTMMHYYWTDSSTFIDSMKAFGYDPYDKSVDPTTPHGIGNLAAKTVIEGCMNDGSNEMGDMAGSNGDKYSDYTGYAPVNPPDRIIDSNRWQQIPFLDADGKVWYPKCLTPHWPKVKPLGLDSGSQHRPGPPPMLGSAELAKDIDSVVWMQAHMAYPERALVEFMRDGPRSVQQAGHWLIFARNISVRDSHTLDQDVKMYFLNQMAAMDGFIACWDAKMAYDNIRPYQQVRMLYKGQTIRGWRGPELGWGEIKGEEWRPYSPLTFVTPPFPSYPSGHSTVSAACSSVLKFYTGSDAFGVQVRLKPGSLTEAEQLQGDSITLNLPTLSATAELAGRSRVLGGYHIPTDNYVALSLGRNVAVTVWKKYLELTGEEDRSITPTYTASH